MMRRGIAVLVGILSLMMTAAACNDEADFAGKSVTGQAEAVLEHLTREDWSALAPYVHPERGVLIAAYTYVEPGENVVLTRDEVASIGADTTTRLWGHQDGTGFPINMTAAEVFDEYILDRDFRDAERGEPNEVIRSGSMINNVPEAFIDSTVEYPDEVAFVEYSLEGSDEYGGMDWASLRLVFQQEDESWFLIGIVRDRWTI